MISACINMQADFFILDKRGAIDIMKKALSKTEKSKEETL